MFSFRLENILACNSSQLEQGCCDPLLNSTNPQWQLSDNGAGGSWKAGANFIQFDIADDARCNGTASETQTGTAFIPFNTDNVETIVLSMTGRAESSYETFKFYIDENLTVTVQATDNDYCQAHTCNMCNVSMAPREVSLSAGNHSLRIEITTRDHLYHFNAFFRIDFSIKQPDVCNSCDCPEIGSKI